MPRTVVDNISVESGKVGHGWIDIGELHDGSKVRLPLSIVSGAEPGPRMLLTSVTHGDEVCGLEAVKKIVSSVNPSSLHGTIIGIPVLNIPAFLYVGRYDPLNPYHEDMADIIKSGQIHPEAAMPHRVALAVHSKLLPQSDCYIDFHSSAAGSINYPRAIITPDWAKIDNELRKKCDDIGFASGFEILFHAKRVGWAGQYFNVDTSIEEKFHIPCLILETGGAPMIDGADELVRGATNVMKYLKMIPGAPVPGPKQVVTDRMIAIRASRGGILHMTVKLRQEVSKGDIVAKITDFFDNVIEEVKAPDKGIIVKIATQGFCSTGYRVAAMATPA